MIKKQKNQSRSSKNSTVDSKVSAKQTSTAIASQDESYKNVSNQISNKKSKENSSGSIANKADIKSSVSSDICSIGIDQPTTDVNKMSLTENNGTETDTSGVFSNTIRKSNLKDRPVSPDNSIMYESDSVSRIIRLRQKQRPKLSSNSSSFIRDISSGYEQDYLLNTRQIHQQYQQNHQNAATTFIKSHFSPRSSVRIKVIDETDTDN